MTKKLVLLAIIILSSTLTAQTDLGYIELNTTNMDQLEEQITALNSSGLRVIHIFPPNAVLVRAGNLALKTDPRNSAIVNFIPPRKFTFHNREFVVAAEADGPPGVIELIPEETITHNFDLENY